MKSIYSSFVLITTFITYISKDLALSRVTSSRNLADQRTRELSIKQQPTIYTYIDYDSRKFYGNQLKLWSKRWSESGWLCKILTSSDSEKYQNYDKVIDRLNKLKLDELERNKYMSYMAMSALPDGGILSDYYTFPLHNNAQVQLPLVEKTEEDIVFTSFDIFDDSFLYGNYIGWNKALEVLVENVENKDSTIKNLEERIPEMNIVSLNIQLDSGNEDIRKSFRRVTHVGMGYGYAFSACKLAKNHFAIRILPSWWTDFSSTDSFSWKFMEFYDNQCFLNREGISERLSSIYQQQQERRPLDHTYSVLHLSEKIDENSKSEVNCIKNSCKITNACITSSSAIKLFGSSQHVQEQKAKLIGYKRQVYACSNCDSIYDITSKGEGTYKLKDGVATLGEGLKNYSCDAHIQHIIWPLLRINLLHRSREEVINNGVGDLFLQMADNFACITTYSPAAEKVSPILSRQI